MYFGRINPDAFRHNFLKQIKGLEPLLQLLDLIPDVAFFMKDRAGRFVAHNRRGFHYCHVGSERETIGKTDHDFYPKDRADMYVAGDRQVMETGVPILNAIAPAPESEGSDRLIVYSKVPLRDRQGKIIGVAGIHREIEGLRAKPKSYGRLARAVRHLQEKYAEELSTEKLASMAGLSASQFERRFHHLFGTPPRQYLLRIRVNAACRLLTETDASVTQVALDVGFYDHSHFSRTFSKLMGASPRAYRRAHRPE